MDAYDVLKLPQRATAAEIKVAYRAAARRTHPDTGGSAAAFDQVQQAYETLRDPARRAALDARREHARRPPQPAAPPPPPQPSPPRSSCPGSTTTEPQSARSRPDPQSPAPRDPASTFGALLAEVQAALRLVLHFLMVATACALWASSRLLLTRLAPLDEPAVLRLAQGVLTRAGAVSVVALTAAGCWAEWRFAVVLRWRLAAPRVRNLTALAVFPALLVGEYLTTRTGLLVLAATWVFLAVLLAVRRSRGRKERRLR